MAVALDNSAGTQTDASGESSISVSITIAGANRAILIAVGQTKDTSGGNNITGVTVGGVSATLVGSAVKLSGSPCVYVYGLIAPATGSQSVVATFGSADGDWPTLMCMSATGVDQTTPFGTVSSSFADTTNTDAAIASDVGDLVTQWLYGPSDFTANSGSTVPTGCSQFTFFGSNRIALGMYKAGAATSTTVGASGATGVVARVGVAFKASAAGPTDPALDDVDTDEIIRSDQTNIVVTGTDLGASAGSLRIIQGSFSRAQTAIDSWSDTSIQFDISFDS